MAEIVLDRVTKNYPDGAMAVKDLSINIADGEFIILVGPSGCGKSTTLNMIAGLEDISSGELRIGGSGSTKRHRRTATSRWCSSPMRLPAHDRPAEHRLPVHAGRRSEGRNRVQGRGNREILDLTELWIASPPNCRAVSVSGWRWAARSCATPRRS